MQIDLRDLKPSVAVRLPDFIKREGGAESFLHTLGKHLSGLPVPREYVTDQLIALIHELGALGIWNELSPSEIAAALVGVNKDIKDTFVSSLPEKARLEVVAAEREFTETSNKKQNSLQGSFARKRRLRSFNTGTLKLISLTFVAHDVRGTIKIDGGIPGDLNHALLYDVLERRTRGYPRGTPFRCTVSFRNREDINIIQIERYSIKQDIPYNFGHLTTMAGHTLDVGGYGVQFATGAMMTTAKKGLAAKVLKVPRGASSGVLVSDSSHTGNKGIQISKGRKPASRGGQKGA